MNGNVAQLHGMECWKCARPARSHNFLTGVTVHVSPFASNCLVHPPRLITEVPHAQPTSDQRASA